METKTAFKTWFDKESGILRSNIYKSFDPESTTAFFDEISSYTEEQQRYFLAFLGEDAQDIIDKETRRLVREKGKQTKWEKIAVYGAKPGLRMMAKIIATAIGRGRDTKFCTDEKEALGWLKAQMEQAKTSKKTS